MIWPSGDLVSQKALRLYTPTSQQVCTIAERVEASPQVAALGCRSVAPFDYSTAERCSILSIDRYRKEFEDVSQYGAEIKKYQRSLKDGGSDEEWPAASMRAPTLCWTRCIKA